jgi:hypothetical protein
VLLQPNSITPTSSRGGLKPAVGTEHWPAWLGHQHRRWSPHVLDVIPRSRRVTARGILASRASPRIAAASAPSLLHSVQTNTSTQRSKPLDQHDVDFYWLAVG